MGAMRAVAWGASSPRSACFPRCAAWIFVTASSCGIPCELTVLIDLLLAIGSADLFPSPGSTFSAHAMEMRQCSEKFSSGQNSHGVKCTKSGGCWAGIPSSHIEKSRSCDAKDVARLVLHQRFVAGMTSLAREPFQDDDAEDAEDDDDAVDDDAGAEDDDAADEHEQDAADQAEEQQGEQQGEQQQQQQQQRQRQV